jgi:MarR family 2-MHQ and catechol resistance regulon transcriptional repressor
VDNLEKRGLVERVRNTEDRRYITVHLTEEGKKLMKRVFPRHAKAIAEEFAVLSPDEQTMLSSLCKKLGLGKPEYEEALTKVRRSSDG